MGWVVFWIVTATLAVLAWRQLQAEGVAPSWEKIETGISRVWSRLRRRGTE